MERILYCPEFRRLVLDFKGLYFVFRPWEFQRFRSHLSRIMACRLSRAGLENGERIRVRDASGRNSLELGPVELRELVELMEGAEAVMKERSDDIAYQPMSCPGKRKILQEARFSG